jgi:hypothetical protein
MNPAATLALGVAFLAVCVVGFLPASRWALRREAERTAAATFERDFIPEAADVADQDTPAMLEEIEALLDDSLTHVKRLQDAANRRPDEPKPGLPVEPAWGLVFDDNGDRFGPATQWHRFDAEDTLLRSIGGGWVISAELVGAFIPVTAAQAALFDKAAS